MRDALEGAVCKQCPSARQPPRELPRAGACLEFRVLVRVCEEVGWGHEGVGGVARDRLANCRTGSPGRRNPAL